VGRSSYALSQPVWGCTEVKAQLAPEDQDPWLEGMSPWYSLGQERVLDGRHVWGLGSGPLWSLQRGASTPRCQ